MHHRLKKDVSENKLQSVYLIVKTKLLRGKTWINLMQGDKWRSDQNLFSNTLLLPWGTAICLL